MCEKDDKLLAEQITAKFTRHFRQGLINAATEWRVRQAGMVKENFVSDAFDVGHEVNRKHDPWAFLNDGNEQPNT